MRLLAVFALTGVAYADGKPCIPPDQQPTLDVTGKTAILCTDAACWSVDDAGTIATATKPARTIDDASNVSVKVDKQVSVCIAGVCKPTGKRLGQLLRAQRDDIVEIGGAGRRTSQSRYVTTDFAIAVVNGKAFSIATDKPLALKAPPEFATVRFTKPKLKDVRAVGKVLVATWSDCKESPCTEDMSVAVDTRGKTQSMWFPAGDVIELDDDRFVVLGRDQTQVTAISSTGKMIGAYTMSDGNISARARRVDAGSIVVFTTAGGYDVHWVDVPKDSVPTRRARHTVPSCPRKP